MKKLIFLLILFFNLGVSLQQRALVLTAAQPVYAQSPIPCPPDPNGGGGGGGFWGWLGGVFDAIGSAVSNVISAIGDFFSGDGGDGETFGDENDYGYDGSQFDYYDPNYYNEPNPWDDPYFNNGGWGDDEWGIIDNLGWWYNVYNNGGTPPCPTVAFNEDPAKPYGYDNFTNASIPWQSVEQTKSAKLVIAVTPATDFPSVFFKSLSTADLTVSPTNAPSAAFDLTVTAAALAGGVNKKETEVQANCGSVDGTNISKVNVVAYRQVTKTVAVRLVHSRPDAASGYTGYTSTDLSDAAIIDYLNNKSYNQGVVKWVVTRLPAMTVAFDINKDSKVDVNSWMSPEMVLIRDSCKDDSYDANIFFVNKPSDGSGGFMNFSQRYGFVHIGMTPTPANDVAHELGHGTFGFTHRHPDVNNIMYDTSVTSRTRFRKDQWDAMH